MNSRRGSDGNSRILRLTLALLFPGVIVSAADVAPPRLASEGLSGYISMSVPAPPEEYGYGVSLYAAAWPLLEKPLRDFQIGLASIWIVPENRKIDYPLLPTGTVARDQWPERGSKLSRRVSDRRGRPRILGQHPLSLLHPKVPHERNARRL